MLEDLLLILHISGAFLMAAAAGITTTAAVMAARAKTPAGIVTWLDLQRVSELFLTTPGAVIALVFGSWLVSEAGFSFSEPWLSAAYTLWLVAMALDHGVFLRAIRRLRAEAASATANVQALQSGLAAPRVRITGLALDASLLVFLVLMVTRPGA